MRLTFNDKFTHKKDRKPYSFRKRVSLVFTFVILLFFLIFLWISLYFTSTLRKTTYTSVRDTLDVYNHQLSHNLEKLHVFMYDMSEYSIDMMQVFFEDDVRSIYNHIIRSKDLLDYSIPSFTEIDGMFLYAPKNDTFIQSYKYQDGTDVSSYIKNQFRSSSTSRRPNTQTWYYEKIKEEYYLIRIIEIHDSYIGSWANITRLSSTFKNLKELNGKIVYVDREGSALSSDVFADFTFPINENMNRYQIVDIGENRSLLVMTELDYCDYYLAAVIPLDNIDGQLTPVYRIFLFLSLLIIFFSMIFLYSVSRFLSKPIRLLERAASQMREGNFEQILPSDMSNCQEIVEIDLVYNRMIEEIHHLRIDIYEEKLAKSKIELQYLKSQMAPHFLINCLFSIMNLAQQPQQNQEVLHQMIETLAGHLRYTLSDQTTVLLEKELHFVRNYIELTQLRFPGCLAFNENVDPSTLEAKVFPLILLMLTENSIKYNMVMGEELEIQIEVKIRLDQGKKILYLRHWDSGDGFQQEQLHSFQHLIANFNQSILESDHQEHIGIPNVAKRLKLLYGEEGRITFSNGPLGGAQIEIEIPYLT